MSHSLYLKFRDIKKNNKTKPNKSYLVPYSSPVLGKVVEDRRG